MSGDYPWHYRWGSNNLNLALTLDPRIPNFILLTLVAFQLISSALRETQSVATIFYGFVYEVCHGKNNNGAMLIIHRQ